MNENKGSSFIRRKRKENNFTQLPNEMLRNENLSWKARGLLAYMLSMPDDWVFYSSELVKHSKKDGEASLRTAMKELKEEGYVAKQAIRNDKGKIIKWETYVDDTPFFKEENNIVQNGGFLHVDNQHVDNQLVENRTLLIPIITNNDNNNNNASDKSEVDKVVDKYKELKNLPGFNKITPTRKKAINARIREEGLEKVIAVLEKLNQDQYYIQAKNDGLNWYKFDYVFNPTKFNMLIERFEKNNFSINNNTNSHQGASTHKEVKVEDLYNGGEW